jgi:hypothetical protein
LIIYIQASLIEWILTPQNLFSGLNILFYSSF